MKKNTIIISVIFAGALLIIALSVYTLYFLAPADPLAGSDQLVLVLAKTGSANEATLITYNREGDSWRFVATNPVVIGKNGLAWGRGLHRENDRLPDEPVKMEGDGASPQGAYELLHAYGYSLPTMVRIAFPYTQTASDLICCDDPDSELYNKIIDAGGRGLHNDNLPSHEKMLRDDDLYKYVIVIGHNTWRPKKGAGSCIFLHLWEGPHSHTSGCTAMSEEHILRLLAWLDIEKKPVLIQLTRKNYYRLKEDWALPDVTI